MEQAATYVACIFLKSAFLNSEEYDPDYEYFHYLNSKVYMTLLEWVKMSYNQRLNNSIWLLLTVLWHPEIQF